MIPSSDIHVQIPLIHVVESDDVYLENQEDVFWFDLLRDLDWRSLRPVAARYYEALWQFNEHRARARAERPSLSAANPETREEATYRLLFERATLCEDAPILHDVEPFEPSTIHVDPATLCPGRTPHRMAGRAPKCFFAMFKAFMGVAVCGTPPEPQFVRQKLIENPSFARTCGFTLPDLKRGYRQSDVPSLRKLEQFDQIMSEHGLWGEAAVGQVAKNLREGYVKLESTLVHDTTHYEAFSSMQVVDLKDFFRHQWEIELLAPINPRRRGPITKDLPRGLDHIPPTGIPVCRQGYPFEFVTCRHDTEKFVFQAPRGEDGTPVCWPCPERPECYRGNAGSRRVTVGFQRLPWLDPEFPQVSKRFANIMARRTVIERLHKLMKHDFGDARLTKRGTKAFQARLDKTLLAMHLALAHG